MSELISQPVYEEELEAALEKAFPNSIISVRDTAGDNQHYSIEIFSDDFEGLTRIKQHRLVHERLNDTLSRIHAMEIKTGAKNTQVD